MCAFYFNFGYAPFRDACPLAKYRSSAAQYNQNSYLFVMLNSRQCKAMCVCAAKLLRLDTIHPCVQLLLQLPFTNLFTPAVCMRFTSQYALGINNNSCSWMTLMHDDQANALPSPAQSRVSRSAFFLRNSASDCKSSALSYEIVFHTRQP